jgi:hypothetical protein
MTHCRSGSLFAAPRATLQRMREAASTGGTSSIHRHTAGPDWASPALIKCRDAGIATGRHGVSCVSEDSRPSQGMVSEFLQQLY